MTQPHIQVEVPNQDYWQRQIKCQYACPVHTDARGYVRAIVESDFEGAYLIARGPNPLASICGRVCGRRARRPAAAVRLTSRFRFAR